MHVVTSSPKYSTYLKLIISLCITLAIIVMLMFISSLSVKANEINEDENTANTSEQVHIEEAISSEQNSENNKNKMLSSDNESYVENQTDAKVSKINNNISASIEDSKSNQTEAGNTDSIDSFVDDDSTVKDDSSLETTQQEPVINYDDYYYELSMFATDVLGMYETEYGQFVRWGLNGDKVVFNLEQLYRQKELFDTAVNNYQNNPVKNDAYWFSTVVSADAGDNYSMTATVPSRWNVEVGDKIQVSILQRTAIVTVEDKGDSFVIHDGVWKSLGFAHHSNISGRQVAVKLSNE